VRGRARGDRKSTPDERIKHVRVCSADKRQSQRQGGRKDGEKKTCAPSPTTGRGGGVLYTDESGSCQNPIPPLIKKGTHRERAEKTTGRQKKHDRKNGVTRKRKGKEQICGVKRKKKGGTQVQKGTLGFGALQGAEIIQTRGQPPKNRNDRGKPGRLTEKKGRVGERNA